MSATSISSNCSDVYKENKCANLCSLMKIISSTLNIISSTLNNNKHLVNLPKTKSLMSRDNLYPQKLIIKFKCQCQ